MMLLRILTIFLMILTVIAVLYLLAICGRGGHGKWDILEKYRYAHRGYHDKPQIPENSLTAFRRAAERGFGAELDVHLLKDGALAVFHDASLKRCTGEKGQIEDLDTHGLKAYGLEGTDERIPLLPEVLKIFEGKTPLIIELKPERGNHRELAAAVCRCLDEYTGDFCIESFDPRVLHEIRKLRPDICRGQLSENYFKDKDLRDVSMWKKFIVTNLLLNFWARPDFVAYHYADRKNPSLRICRKLWGIHEVCWTIRSREAMEEAERAGCLVIFEKFDPDERKKHAQ